MRRTFLLLFRRLVTALLNSGLVPRFIFLRKLNRQLVAALTKREAVVRNHKMILDPIDSLRLAQNGEYEPFQTDISLELLRSGDSVIDIGANIGYYTLQFAYKVGSEGHVFAFEADPGNCEILRRNLALNGYHNVTAECKAVWHRTESLRLVRAFNSDGHHYIGSGRENNTIEVEAVSIDDYFSDRDVSISLIKMDIEGAELWALQGMKRLLSSNSNTRLIIEFSPRSLVRSGADPSDYLTFLQKLGYSVRIINEGERRIDEVSTAEILERYTVENGRYVNLICTQ